MTNYSRSVLKSNGLRHPKNLPVKFGFSSKSVPANIGKKLPPQCCSKLLLIPFFNFSHKWPTFAFAGESGIHSALLKEPYTMAHTAKQGAFRMGGGITTLGAFHTVRKPPRAGCQNGKFCRFWVLAGGTPKERREPAGQRCAYARRCSAGTAAPLGCVICLQLGDVAVFSLCAQYFLNVRGGGGITTLGAFHTFRKPCVAGV